ncbi:MAG: hypothetical protein RBT41_03875 [Clostridia bacterium]|jgi:tetratricopeptide (TPR) repeat protein|nr:hypothetical protein [Clostridia bacterium]
MREYQPWDDSWSEQLVYLLIPGEIDAPVEMPAHFYYPIFLGAFEKKLNPRDFWQAIAGSMIYVLGHRPSHADVSSYIYWLNTYNPHIAAEIIHDGIEQASWGDYARAAWLFQAAVLLDPNRTEGHFNLGLTYYQMGLTLTEKDSGEEAESCFLQAAQYLKNTVELDEYFSLAYYNLGFVYQRLGLRDESKKYMEQGITQALARLSSGTMHGSYASYKDLPAERE